MLKVTDAKAWNGVEDMWSLSIIGYSEPVDFKHKGQPPSNIDGEVIKYQTKKGNWRQKVVTGKAKEAGDIIRGQWAIGQALMYAPDHTDLENIKVTAQALYKLAEEVANG